MLSRDDEEKVSVFKNRDDAAHIIQRGNMGFSPAGEDQLEGSIIPDILAVYFIFKLSVLEESDVRMLFQILDIFLKAEIHMMHDRGIAFADIAVEIHL